MYIETVKNRESNLFEQKIMFHSSTLKTPDIQIHLINNKSTFILLLEYSSKALKVLPIHPDLALKSQTHQPNTYFIHSELPTTHVPLTTLKQGRDISRGKKKGTEYDSYQLINKANYCPSPDSRFDASLISSPASSYKNFATIHHHVMIH